MPTQAIVFDAPLQQTGGPSPDCGVLLAGVRRGTNTSLTLDEAIGARGSGASCAWSTGAAWGGGAADSSSVLSVGLWAILVVHTLPGTSKHLTPSKHVLHISKHMYCDFESEAPSSPSPRRPYDVVHPLPPPPAARR